MAGKPEPLQPIEILFHALTDAPGRLTVAPLMKSVIEVRRPSRRRRADLRLAITDQMAKECRADSDPDRRPVYLLVGIPRDLALEIEAKQDRRIIRPGEERLVKPAGGLVVSR